MLSQPYEDVLAASRCVLLAGAGSGYDVVGAIPLFDSLRAHGKVVHLASLTFIPPTVLDSMAAACFSMRWKRPPRSGRSIAGLPAFASQSRSESPRSSRCDHALSSAALAELLSSLARYTSDRCRIPGSSNCAICGYPSEALPTTP